MSRPVNPVLDLDLDLYPGLSGLSIRQKAPVQHPETNIGPSSPHWGEKEQTVFVHVPLITGTVPSQYLKILASKGNPASYVQADGKNNISYVLAG